MKMDTETLMMIAFVIAMIISVWKLYAFLPAKQLADDDTTNDSQEELLDIVLDVIRSSEVIPDIKTIHDEVLNHDRFDKEHFWRFNPNKLKQILNLHYIKNPHLQNIEDIHKELKT